MVGDEVGTLGDIAVIRSLHFQASLVNADSLTTGRIVRAVLSWATATTGHLVLPDEH